MSDERLMRFRLLRGHHVEADPENPTQDKHYRAEIKDPVTGDMLYKGQNIITTKRDLRFLDRPGYPPKFELIPDVEALPVGAHIYDPAKETPEEFLERMHTISQASS